MVAPVEVPFPAQTWTSCLQMVQNQNQHLQPKSSYKFDSRVWAALPRHLLSDELLGVRLGAILAREGEKDVTVETARDAPVA